MYYFVVVTYLLILCSADPAFHIVCIIILLLPSFMFIGKLFGNTEYYIFTEGHDKLGGLCQLEQ